MDFNKKYSVKDAVSYYIYVCNEMNIENEEITLRNVLENLVKYYHENKISHAYLIETNNLEKCYLDLLEVIKQIFCQNEYNKEAYECNKINYLYYIFDKDNITFKTGLNKIETMSISSSKFANNYDFLSAYIGRDYRNELVTLGGKLYSFKIYNKVLNQGEIENEYNFEVSRFKK